jgi:hypothetical protein
MERIPIAAAIVIMAGMAAAAAHAQGSDTPAKNDPNRITCKRINQTGSRTRYTKVCATAAEWKAAENRSQNLLTGMQGKSLQGSGAIQQGPMGGGSVQ